MPYNREEALLQIRKRSITIAIDFELSLECQLISLHDMLSVGAVQNLGNVYIGYRLYPGISCDMRALRGFIQPVKRWCDSNKSWVPGVGVVSPQLPRRC